MCRILSFLTSFGDAGGARSLGLSGRARVAAPAHLAGCITTWAPRLTRSHFPCKVQHKLDKHRNNTQYLNLDRASDFCENGGSGMAYRAIKTFYVSIITLAPVCPLWRTNRNKNPSQPIGDECLQTNRMKTSAGPAGLGRRQRVEVGRVRRKPPRRLHRPLEWCAVKS